MSGPRVLMLDIETMPGTCYIWSAKTRWINPKQVVSKGYTGCFAARWYGEPKNSCTFHSIPKDGFRGMIEAAWRLIDEADALIHFNGKKFDVPTLNREFCSLELGPPSPAHDIDLLAAVRARFRLMHNNLDEVAKWLGIGGKIQNRGMELWRDCMHPDPNDPVYVRAWKEMERYNRQDVHLLSDLFDRLRPWLTNNVNWSLWNIDGEIKCAHCGSYDLTQEGTRKTLTHIYPRYRCRSCGGWSRGKYTLLSPEESRGVLRQA